MSRFVTACSGLVFDFSALLGILWTISGVFNSPLLGKVSEFYIFQLRTVIVRCVPVRSFLVAVHFDLWLQTGSASCASVSCSRSYHASDTGNHFVIIDCRLEHLTSSLVSRDRIGYDIFFPRTRLISLKWNLFLSHSKLLALWQNLIQCVTTCMWYQGFVVRFQND